MTLTTPSEGVAENTFPQRSTTQTYEVSPWAATSAGAGVGSRSTSEGSAAERRRQGRMGAGRIDRRQARLEVSFGQQLVEPDVDEVGSP